MNELNHSQRKIGAVVLAAGLSQRMGKPKMILPWGNTSVIGQVVNILMNSDLDEIVVVTGATDSLVREALKNDPVRFTFNPNYSNGEMLLSLKIGMQELSPAIKAAMIVLGDQPQIETRVVRGLIKTYLEKDKKIIIPSYNLHRGHPWLVDRELWGQILELNAPMTLRDFLNQNNTLVYHYVVDNECILVDLDTPEEYERQKPCNNCGED